MNTEDLYRALVDDDERELARAEATDRRGWHLLVVVPAVLGGSALAVVIALDVLTWLAEALI